jgi:hypothetical protein
MLTSANVATINKKKYVFLGGALPEVREGIFRRLFFRGYRKMMIEVLLKGDSENQVVADYVLGELLSRGRVQGFRRSSGWVEVGRDPIRQSRVDIYYGRERRKRRNSSCLSCPEMVRGECVKTSCPEFRSQTKIFPLGSV